MKILGKVVATAVSKTKDPEFLHSVHSHPDAVAAVAGNPATKLETINSIADMIDLGHFNKELTAISAVPRVHSNIIDSVVNKWSSTDPSHKDYSNLLGAVENIIYWDSDHPSFDQWDYSSARDASNAIKQIYSTRIAGSHDVITHPNLSTKTLNKIKLAAKDHLNLLNTPNRTGPKFIDNTWSRLTDSLDKIDKVKFTIGNPSTDDDYDDVEYDDQD